VKAGERKREREKEIESKILCHDFDKEVSPTGPCVKVQSPALWGFGELWNI
jgi:hypothetical protein